MTDAETITKEMPPYNVFDERCPTRNVLARIADKMGTADPCTSGKWTDAL